MRCLETIKVLETLCLTVLVLKQTENSQKYQLCGQLLMISKDVAAEMVLLILMLRICHRMISMN